MDMPPASRDGRGRLEITMTSVGRATLIETFDSFFSHLRTTSTFRVLVTVDRPDYGVDAEERTDTLAYLRGLAGRPEVVDVDVVDLGRHVGLAGALQLLAALSTADVGVHLEDDWRFDRDLDLDALEADLADQGAVQVMFTSSHTARGGTFVRAGESVQVPDTRVALRELTPASWAFGYLPLAPHLHSGPDWRNTVARALITGHDTACVDQRVRDFRLRDGLATKQRVLWSEDVMCHDTGRDWLAARGRYRTVGRGLVSQAPEDRPAATPDGGPLRLDLSQQWRLRAERVIPGMTQTFQKRPANFSEGEYPVYLESGSGAVVRDVDGTHYTDFVCALGAATLGHGHPAVTNTVQERVGRSVLLSLPSPTEVSAAEEIVAAVRSIEMVRFVKTGAEACAAAIRLARYVTGRELVVSTGYHGWHDDLITTGPGVPAATVTRSVRLALADKDDEARLLDRVAQSGDQLAAVLFSTPYQRAVSTTFLAELQARVAEAGALLVMDEIVTGFRLSAGGLSDLLPAPADLVCLSKGLAAGMPLAAVGGRAEHMRSMKDLTVSTTFGGESLSLEVMRSVQRVYAATDYYQHIGALGRTFREGVNLLCHERGMEPLVAGYDPMPCLVFSAAARSADWPRRLLGGLARRGFLLRRDVNFLNAAHRAEDVSRLVSAAADALDELLATS
jgi:glutamate-1-semialdehyde aminotransferase